MIRFGFVWDLIWAPIRSAFRPKRIWNFMFFKPVISTKQYNLCRLSFVLTPMGLVDTMDMTLGCLDWAQGGRTVLSDGCLHFARSFSPSFLSPNESGLDPFNRLQFVGLYSVLSSSSNSKWAMNLQGSLNCTRTGRFVETSTPSLD